MPLGKRLARHLGESFQADAKYLTYHGATVTYGDLRALRQDWLTDSNISFWQTYLEFEVLSRYPEARIHLLRPSISMMLGWLRTDELRQNMPNFRQQGTTHIFVPVNNSHDVGSTDEGTHWSLLLVSIVDCVAFHYDSLGACNIHNARDITSALARLLGLPLRFRNIDDTPRQANNNDCGVFVCILMRFLLVKRLLNAHAREKVSMSLGGKMIDAEGGRKEMIKTIENLRREAERRESERTGRSVSPFVRGDGYRID